MKTAAVDSTGMAQSHHTSPAAARAGNALLCALLVGVVYFMGARLGLAMLTQAENVAVFWPASGVGAGMLVLLGRWALVPVAAGIFAATIAANLLGDRNIPLAIVFGACNAGEAFIFAWLLDRRLARRYAFDSLPRAICFFGAATASTALMAFCAALAIKGFTASSAPTSQIWLAWFSSDATGMITIAPLVISLGGLAGRSWPRYEVLESLLVLVILLIVSAVTYLMPPFRADWWMPVPVAALFPLLLWAAARCPPVVVSTGLMLVSMIIVWATSNGLGHFGDPAVPVGDRVFAARVTMVSIAMCSVILIAVFAERRLVEAAVRASEQRFTKLAASAPGIIFTFRIDADGRRSLPYVSPAIASIMAIQPEEVRDDATPVFSPIDPRDAAPVAAKIEASRQALTPFHTEFRYRHPHRGLIWMEAHSSPVLEADGAVVWHGFMQDVTGRKSAEKRIRSLMREVDHRGKNLLAVVEGVALNTMNEERAELFTVTFSQRIRGLAASHDLLTSNAWQGVSLAELVRSQLAHFASLFGTRIVMAGPDVSLNPAAAQSIGMALHELATNASKYGALANDSGRVEIAWTAGSTVAIYWRESGGAAVTPPTRRGFGHKVMVDMLQYEIGARVDLAFGEAGLSWTMAAPAAQVIQRGGESVA